MNINFSKFRLIRLSNFFLICFLLLLISFISGCADCDNPEETSNELLIVLPEEGDSYREGEIIQFQGSAFNSNGDALSEDLLIWTSDVDGLFGSGNDFDSSRLSSGSHQICFSVVNAENEESEDCISINIQQPLLTQISAGFDHVLAVGIDGGLWAWGANGFGQLGDGSTESQSAPVRVGTDSKWSKAVAGGRFSVGLKSDGTLWTWGYDFVNYGPNQLSPILLSDEGTWIDVDAGNFRITAINSNGQCYIWEGGHWYIDPFEGFIGEGPDSDWKVSATGFRHVLLIKADGTLWCRSKSVSIDGYDRFYNLNNWSWFRQVGEEDDWVQIDAYENQGIALKADGSLYSLSFEEGDVTITQIGTDMDWEVPSIGQSNCAVTKTDGSLWVCDDYEQGQPISALQQYEDEYDWLTVSSGNDFTVALKVSGNPVFVFGSFDELH